jgi:Cu/Ag efflux pump CusA
LPVLRLCLKYRKTTLLLNLVFLVVTFPLIFRMGSQFMPPLFEGSSLYMPTALPGISITQASQLLQEQDREHPQFTPMEQTARARPLLTTSPRPAFIGAPATDLTCLVGSSNAD